MNKIIYRVLYIVCSVLYAQSLFSLVITACPWPSDLALVAKGELQLRPGHGSSSFESRLAFDYAVFQPQSSEEFITDGIHAFNLKYQEAGGRGGFLTDTDRLVSDLKNVPYANFILSEDQYYIGKSEQEFLCFYQHIKRGVSEIAVYAPNILIDRRSRLLIAAASNWHSECGSIFLCKDLPCEVAQLPLDKFMKKQEELMEQYTLHDPYVSGIEPPERVVPQYLSDLW